MNLLCLKNWLLVCWLIKVVFILLDEGVLRILCSWEPILILYRFFLRCSFFLITMNLSFSLFIIICSFSLISNQMLTTRLCILVLCFLSFLSLISSLSMVMNLILILRWRRISISGYSSSLPLLQELWVDFIQLLGFIDLLSSNAWEPWWWRPRKWWRQKEWILWKGWWIHRRNIRLWVHLKPWPYWR